MARCPGCGGNGPGLPYLHPPERLAANKPASLFAFRVATESQVAAGDWRCRRCTQRRHALRPKLARGEAFRGLRGNVARNDGIPGFARPSTVAVHEHPIRLGLPGPGVGVQRGLRFYPPEAGRGDLPRPWVRPGV